MYPSTNEFDEQAYEQYQESYQTSAYFWRRASHVYDNTYCRFLEWLIQHPDANKGPIRTSATGKNRRYANMLYDFFASNGLMVNITGTLTDKQPGYTFQIQQDSNVNYQVTDPEALACKQSYTTRFDAETAAFKVAFAVLDQWLADQAKFGIRPQQTRR